MLISSLALAMSFATTAVEVTPDCRACETGDRFYEMRSRTMAWTGPANATLWNELLDAIRNAETHGLDPYDYRLAQLSEIDPTVPDERADALATDAYLTLAAHLLEGRLNPVTIEPDWTAARRGRDLAAYLQSALVHGAILESLEGLAPQQPGYAALRSGLARYQSIRDEGGWPIIDEGPTLRAGDRTPRVAQLRARLAATGDVTAEADDLELFDDTLDEAVRRFQHRASLDADGIVGSRTLAQLNTPVEDRIRQIEANLERWRWLPDDLGRRHIRVNIADYELQAWSNGEIERTHEVIVGQLYRRTPVFSGTMSYFVLNPWWETPPSLAVRDKLPAFRRDPTAVSRLGFQVIDASGNLVDPDTVNWEEVPARGFPYRLRQAPGPLNALGEVKFMFPNPHNVYLHDTPTRGLFAQRQRNFSSGCVRVRDPIALAAWVAADTENWTPERIVEVAAGNDETRINLTRHIPVHILYLTAVPDEDAGIRFLNDIYERDGRLIEALAEG